MGCTFDESDYGGSTCTTNWSTRRGEREREGVLRPLPTNISGGQEDPALKWSA